MHVALVGLGTTGSHIARQLMTLPVETLSIHDTDRRRLDRVGSVVQAVAGDRRVIAQPHDAGPPADVVILATPAGDHAERATSMLAAGSHVVSLSDDPDDVERLLALDDAARRADRSIVVGAGFVPGLSCVLTRFAADQLDTVDVINVYKAGTGGPACARQHHRALKSAGHDWVDGSWVLRRGGSGRELAWFPEPFGAHDCYRGALPSPILLQRQYPEATRISARMSATRRDRFTSRLPMLRPPHDDGGPGGVRVEVRGGRGVAVESIILGAMDHPSVASATVAAVAATETAAGRAPGGSNGLVAWPDPRRWLALLRQRGIRVASFTGYLDTAPADA